MEATEAKEGIRERVETRRRNNGLRGPAEIIRELRDDVVLLLRQEMQLLRTEMREKVSKVTRNSIYLAVGALVGYAAFVFLLQAAAYGIHAALSETLLDPLQSIWISNLIIGTGTGLLALVLILGARATIRKESLKPEKTIETMRGNSQWAHRKTE